MSDAQQKLALLKIYSIISGNTYSGGKLENESVVINAANQLSISAKTLKTQSIDSTTQYTGTTFEQYTKGNHTLKVNSKMSFESKGESSLNSGGTNYINGGPNIMLNSGSGSLNPEEVKQLPITAHYDTLYDSSKGYVSTPDKLQSIVSRAPTHSPWEDANKGVNVKTNLDAGANLPAAPSPSLESVNQSTQNASVTTTTPSVTATVPQVSNASNNLDQGSTVALASQLAVNAGNGPAKDAIATNAGVVSGADGKMASLSPYGLNPSQLVATGYLKPGTDVAINKLINEGKTLDEAMPDNCWTGKDGITSTQSFLNSKQAQSNAAVNLISQGEKSMIDAGIITGNESPTQTGGVILSAVSAGVASTVDYVKTSASSAISVDAPITSPTVNSVTNVSASSLSGVISPYAIKPSNAIASGNNATAMADSFKTGNKSKSNFSLKGSVAGLFNKAVSKFKSLKPNIPQKLTGVISDAGDKALDKTLASTLGTGGPVNIKIASAIKNSFNSGALSAQSTKLLGDKGIPPLAIDATSTTPKEQSAEGGKKYDTLKAELTKLDDDKWVLRKKYYDAKKIYGDSSPEAQAAEADYKKCLQRIEEVRKEMFKASTS
jgi:hypothetical protein